MLLIRILLSTLLILTLPKSYASRDADFTQDTATAVHFVLKIDLSDLHSFAVDIRIAHPTEHFSLAMATHNEYDERYWRFVKDFRVETSGGIANYKKRDNAVWDISLPTGSQGEVRVSYRLLLPVTRRYAYQPFLSDQGGLVGDLHSFMYVVGLEDQPCDARFLVPQGWQIASGLQKTSDDQTFIAPSERALLDCPVLVGNFHQWEFKEGGIQHLVAYQTRSATLAFDSLLFVSNIQKIVRESIKIFKAFPYERYSFILEDSVFGALEHGNSLTLGVPQSMIKSGMDGLYEQIAHEYFHTWNLLDIQPAEYSSLHYGPKERSTVLWFSEGLTMFYADLLTRRAGLPCSDSTRIAHLQALISRYYESPGNREIPPQEASLASNELPGLLGDYMVSVHLQGELLGAMLDLIIRSCSNGRRSFDDVMRLVYQNYGSLKGINNRQIEASVLGACSSDSVRYFFSQFIFHGAPLEFNRFLRLAGLEMKLTFGPARDTQGLVLPDTRLYIWQDAPESPFRLANSAPNTCWAAAGLRTGDTLVSINGQVIQDRHQFYDLINKVHTNDTVLVNIVRRGNKMKIPVAISGFQKCTVEIGMRPDASPTEKDIFRAWSAAN